MLLSACSGGVIETPLGNAGASGAAHGGSPGIGGAAPAVAGSGGAGNSSCYTPDRRADRPDAPGCPCDESANPTAVCRGGTGYSCVNSTWQMFADGPCSPPVGDQDCYSPYKSIDLVYKQGAHGCPCDEASSGAGVCRGGTAFLCIDSTWQAVEDGPCAPPVGHGGSGGMGGGGSGGTGAGGSGGGVSKAYSVEACKTAGGIPVPSIGTRQDPAVDCESGVALGVIDSASSGWIEGGLCCVAPTGKACGARAGNTCAPDEYCAYMAGQYCGQADAEARCKPRPSAACIELYAPVCGCDHKVYDNSCFANAAGTGIYKAGPCD